MNDPGWRLPSRRTKPLDPLSVAGLRADRVMFETHALTALVTQLNFWDWYQALPGPVTPSHFFNIGAQLLHKNLLTSHL